jgi:hypothetical protein
MKYLVPVAIAAAALAFAFMGIKAPVVNTSTPVQTVHYCPRAGYCPPGGCLKFHRPDGGPYACDILACNVADCWQ